MDQRSYKLSTIVALIATLAAAPLVGYTQPRFEQTSEETDFIGGSVSRSAFTEAVVNREPIGDIAKLTNDKQFIYYFSELKGMAGQTVTHRWLFNGEPISEVKFNVGAPRWRVWSSTILKNNELGTWEVQVLNELNQVIHTDRFNYVRAAAK